MRDHAATTHLCTCAHTDCVALRCGVLLLHLCFYYSPRWWHVPLLGVFCFHMYMYSFTTYVDNLISLWSCWNILTHAKCNYFSSTSSFLGGLKGLLQRQNELIHVNNIILPSITCMSQHYHYFCLLCFEIHPCFTFSFIQFIFISLLY